MSRDRGMALGLARILCAFGFSVLLAASGPGLAQAPAATAPGLTSAAPAPVSTGVTTTDLGLTVEVLRKGDLLDVNVSFALPLSRCQAWAFLTDYDSVSEIPGVLEARSERLDATTVRLERVVTERVLVYDLKFHTLVEARELPGQGLDFVQLKGDMKRYWGSWRIESGERRSVFRYRAQMEPDSFLPMAVIRAATQGQMERSFAAMARIGLRHGATNCS